VNRGRVLVMIAKELRELRRNPMAFVPVVVMAVVALAVPFIVTFGVPMLTGQSLATDANFARAVATVSRGSIRYHQLTQEAALEAFVFEQCLLFFVLIPIAGSVSLAAYAVIGEKQGRTLEALLATPITSGELLLAKMVAGLLPPLAIEAAALVLLFGLVAAFAPAIIPVIWSPRMLLIVGLVGPLGAMASLQATVAVSARVNDPRTAQQVAVFFVLPISGLLVAQFSGSYFISNAGLLIVAAVLALAWVVFLLLAIALFDRETILTRWR
jgi:ABC-2 type transport system permease protein